MKKLLHNKKGLGPLAIVLTIAAIVAAVALIFWVGQSVTQPTPQEDLVATGNCQTAPYLDLVGKNASRPGDLIGTVPTYNHQLNGDWRGTMTSGSSGTNFNIGDQVEILAAKGGVIDAIIGTYSVDKCGANTFDYSMHSSTANTATLVFNDQGNVVTDDVSGGATNQSASTTTINQEVKFVANSKESTGDLLVVIEVANTTEVDSISLVGATSAKLPDFYTVASTAAIARAFLVPALVDGQSKVYGLQFVPENGENIGATGTTVLLTAYEIQSFVDTDGSFVSDQVEDSDGSSQSLLNFDYDWCIGVGAGCA